MAELDWPVDRLEEHRPRLRGVAYQMLGSLSEADDAVQEAWLRVSRAGADGVENLGAWLTTVVGRVCPNMLRARKARPEEPLGPRLPDPIVSPVDGMDPEHEAILADSVGLALLVVLDTLEPAGRLAFVLHDSFAVPFEEIAPIVGRTPTATRQLASRARRRVRVAVPVPDADLNRQREAVAAFLAAAARTGDFAALVSVLNPNVVLRSDGDARHRRASELLRGAETVAVGALTYARLSPFVHPALVNGAAGVVVAPRGRPYSVMGFAVVGGKIVAIDALADPDRLRRLDLKVFAAPDLVP
jgi:RNA polymerase sigma-70 factor (ECF subfamily)